MLSLLGKVTREVRTVATLARIKRAMERYPPDAAITVADVFEDVVDRRPSHAAIVFEDRTVSYRELDEASNRLGNWARAIGLQRGDAAALFMENRPEFLQVWLGLAKVGVQTALINTNLSGSSLAHALRVSGANVHIVGAELAERYETARGHGDDQIGAWILRDSRAAAGGTAYKDLDGALADSNAARPPRAAREAMRAADNLFFIYTSGTTGLPKAARFSHGRFLQVGAAYSVIAKASHRDVVYCCLPLYHTAGGVIAVSMALLNGGTLALRRRFSASAFWEDCRRANATIFQYIGELCRYLLNRPASPDDRRHGVRCAVGNGLRPDIWERFQRRFGIRDIREFYGATEGNFGLVNLDNKVGAVGRVPPYLKRLFPVELIRFDVEDETHPRGPDGFCIRCEPGEVGEAIGRIPDDPKEPVGRFEGYSDAEASEKKILHDVFERGDAWYRTGDLLSYDAEGYYYFVDRIGDTFRWKGENVATSEVAEVLAVFDGVLDVNVYGVRIPGADGRAGMAALVCDDTFDLARFYAYVSDRLPPYARPLFLRMRGQLETTATFKHRKVDLVRDGFDPAKVKEPLYFRDDAVGAYVALDPARYEEIIKGTRPV